MKQQDRIWTLATVFGLISLSVCAILPSDKTEPLYSIHHIMNWIVVVSLAAMALTAIYGVVVMLRKK